MSKTAAWRRPNPGGSSAAYSLGGTVAIFSKLCPAAAALIVAIPFSGGALAGDPQIDARIHEDASVMPR